MRTTILMILLSIGLFPTLCQAQMGTAAGVVSGGVIGNSIGHNPSSTILGSLIGGLVGNSLDKATTRTAQHPAPAQLLQAKVVDTRGRVWFCTVLNGAVDQRTLGPGVVVMHKGLPVHARLLQENAQRAEPVQWNFR